MQTIGVAVKGLGTPDELVPTVKQLGERHANCGLRQQHYATVGEALAWALEQGHESAMTPDVRDVWAAVYTLVSGVMLEAANAVGTEA